MGVSGPPTGETERKRGVGGAGERHAKLNKRTNSRSREHSEMGASGTGLDQELKVRGAHSEVTICTDS